MLFKICTMCSSSLHRAGCKTIFGVQHKNALLMSGMMAVNDDSDDSLDSEDDDSEDPGSRQQSPAANGGASTSTGAGARAAGENKRERPEDMKDKFVAVKRANVPLASLPPTRERSAPSSARATPNPTEVPANVAADGVQLPHIH